MEEELLMQYEYVRRLGDCNMLDRNCVQLVANQHDFFRLVTITDNPRQYNNLLINYNSPDEAQFQEWCEENGLTQI